MKTILELFAVVQSKVQPPVAIILGSPWPVTQLVSAMPVGPVTCFQMDQFQAERLRDKLREHHALAEVVVAPDLWDLPAQFRTAIFPAAAGLETELKLDMVEQMPHILQEGGLAVTFSEYEKDLLFPKRHKKVFGQCSQSPTSKQGMVFWSVKTGDFERRRHRMTFHARIGEHPSQHFDSYPGTFSYGRMDAGSRAMLEVVDSLKLVRPGHQVLDMGCGNGSVGCLAYPWTQPGGRVVFVDSHARATALTTLNTQHNGHEQVAILNLPSMDSLPDAQFDVVLANPPYYANSEVARMFIDTGLRLLKPQGRFLLVTKMPVQTIPEVVDRFAEVESIENRGYTIILGTATPDPRDPRDLR